MVDGFHQGAIVLIFVPTFLCPAALLVISAMIVRKRNGASLSWTSTSPILWDFIGLAVLLVLTIAWSIVVCALTHVGLGNAEPPQDIHVFEKVCRPDPAVTCVLSLTMSCSPNTPQSSCICSRSHHGSSRTDCRAPRSSGWLTRGDESNRRLWRVASLPCFWRYSSLVRFNATDRDFWAIRSHASASCFNRVSETRLSVEDRD